MVTLSIKLPLGDTADFRCAFNEATDEFEISLDNGCEGYGCSITREQAVAIQLAIAHMLRISPKGVNATT